MSPGGRWSRREFLERTVAAGVAASAAQAAIAQGDAPGSNDRIHVGIIGCGGMGTANLSACAQHPDVVVTGACDIWPARRDAVCEAYKESCKPYTDYREMLAQPDIDAVIIATPPHWHALQAVEACEAGKDIYLQKPMTLHLAEGLAVRNAVKEHGIVSQVGTQIHAGENYRRVVERIRAGQLGQIGVVRTFHVDNQMPNGLGTDPNPTPPEGFDWDMWCGPAPLIEYNSLLVANSYNHCSWMDYSGGWMPGMAPHIIDLPIWALELGLPTEVSCCGGRYFLRDDGDAYDNLDVLWRYPSLTMQWWSSATNSYGFDFHGDSGARRRLGVYFHGSEATMWADYGGHTIVPERADAEVPDPPEHSIPPSPGHEREWLDCIKTREEPSCSVAYHIKVDAPITLALLAYRLGRSIRFDPENERIIDDREAARLARPEYRDPWEFPKKYL